MYIFTRSHLLPSELKCFLCSSHDINPLYYIFHGFISSDHLPELMEMAIAALSDSASPS